MSPVSFRAYLLPDGWKWEGDLQHERGGWRLTASGPPLLGRHKRPAVTAWGNTQEGAITTAVELATTATAKGK